MYLSREKSYYVKLRRQFYLNAGFLNDSFLPLILNVKVPVGVGFVGDLKLVSGFNQTYEKYEKETGI